MTGGVRGEVGGGDQVTEAAGSTRREWSAAWEAADRPEK